MISRSIYVNGIHLHYKMKGNGDPLLLLHGWTQSAAFWTPYIDNLAKQYLVYALDLRGHGQTGTLPPGFSIEKASVDVEEFATKLNLRNARAIGLSYGGLLLLEIARRNTFPLKDIVLIGVSDRYDGRVRWRDQPRIDVKTLDSAFQEYLRANHPFGESQINALFDKDLDYAIEISESELRNFKTRVLLVNGDSDAVVGLEGVLRIFRNVPGARLWIVPGKGHVAIDETNTGEFLGVTAAFFGQK